MFSGSEPTKVTSPDGTWGKICKECGRGMNLKLDPQHSGSKCRCQQDSIRVTNFLDQAIPFAGTSFQTSMFSPSSTQPTPVYMPFVNSVTNPSHRASESRSSPNHAARHTGAVTGRMSRGRRSSCDSNPSSPVHMAKSPASQAGHAKSPVTQATSTFNPLYDIPEPGPPLISYLPDPPYMPQPPGGSMTRSLNLPKRFQVDRNKLMASVYAKAGCTSPPPKQSDKVVLRYTDGGIQKPEVPVRKATNAFPKLVSRYVSRKSSRDGVPMYIETYKQNSKLTVVTQSFL